MCPSPQLGNEAATRILSTIVFNYGRVLFKYISSGNVKAFREKPNLHCNKTMCTLQGDTCYEENNYIQKHTYKLYCN